MTCKGICERHRAPRPANGSRGGRYSAGQKRCQTCQIFIKWDGGVWCPCCGGKLRAKPRNTADRKRAAAVMDSSNASYNRLQLILRYQ